jgi:cytochrome oxidase assembly protein ShyY1
MTSEVTGPQRERPPSVVGVIVAALVAAASCGWLGVWQWDRAHSRAAVARDGEAVPIAEMAAPSSDASTAIGRSVEVTGVWADDEALVWGREVDGVPSVLLVRSLIVPSDQTGSGAEARIAVLVGYAATDRVTCMPPDLVTVTVSGYLRASEPPPVVAKDAPAHDLCGARDTTVLSVAEFAQTWPGPLYSAVLVSDGGAGGGVDGWAPMPKRDPVTRLNLQSLLYAAEWWTFGAFAVVLAFRWVRENGRDRTGEPRGARDG